VRSRIGFLVDSVRADGSWPIDTNLATWNTTLALNALAAGGADVTEHGNLDWLLGCQNTRRHPYTGADPGGWGWSDLSGAVPDADDTSGALLAIHHWYRAPRASAAERARIARAAKAGVAWLLDLQNTDGGWPTFCRGWGKLPFDRSGSDMTAHAMRALWVWRHLQPRPVAHAIARGWNYLRKTQRADGSWIPLWFGDQDEIGAQNPVYGTARVLLAFAQLADPPQPALHRALHWLAARQQPDGRWRHASSDHVGVEQTALALAALAACDSAFSLDSPPLRTALQKGFSWLIQAVLADQHQESAPIGFYFAKLWYYERLYPVTFTTAALGRGVCRGGGPAARREPTYPT